MAIKKADVKKIVRERYGAVAREAPINIPAQGNSC
jgi:hypothetical protein